MSFSTGHLRRPQTMFWGTRPFLRCQDKFLLAMPIDGSASRSCRLPSSPRPLLGDLSRPIVVVPSGRLAARGAARNGGPGWFFGVSNIPPLGANKSSLSLVSLVPKSAPPAICYPPS
jgi:hypothetical protein